MFRLSNLIASVVEDKPERSLDGSIAIWNFTNRCNLSCLHCYSKSGLDAVDTLSTEDIKKTILQMKDAGVKFIIFSGGEPLTRKDIFEIAEFCRQNGIITYLSSNGLYFTKGNVKKITETFNYVGVSIDGDEKTHDYFRGLPGAFRETLKAVKLANEVGQTKVGIRFTMTKDTIGSLEYIFELAEKEHIPKIYISHLVYSGRGFDNLKMDLSKEQRREAVEFIIDKAFEYYESGRDIEIVTGNMEMDAILLLKRFGEKYPQKKEQMRARLLAWGGNSAGRKLLNINSEGDVRPDPFFPFTIGNILKEDFRDIWKGGELLDRLREHPRKLGGICSECRQIEICNGGSRARAYAITGDLWSEDPSCYLTPEERENEL